MPTDNFQEKDSKIFGSKLPRRSNPIQKLQKIRGIVMGIIILTASSAFMWYEKEATYPTFGKTFTIAIVVVCYIYGLFRLYRSLMQKNNY